jgi:hypothetical protein
MDTVLKISVALIVFFYAVLYLLNVQWSKLLNEKTTAYTILAVFLSGCGYVVYQNSLTYIHNRNVENARLGKVDNVNQNKGVEKEVNPKPNIPSTRILGVRLGDNIRTYKILRMALPDPDAYFIDPSTFERPGAMGHYKWTYKATVDSNGTVYKVECLLPDTTIPHQPNEGDPKGLTTDLIPAIRAVYPDVSLSDYLKSVEVAITPLDFTTHAKDDYDISVKAKVALDIDVREHWTANISIYHGETLSTEMKNRLNQRRQDLIKKNEGF